jgi:hypothetical protein
MAPVINLDCGLMSLKARGWVRKCEAGTFWQGGMFWRSLGTELHAIGFVSPDVGRHSTPAGPALRRRAEGLIQFFLSSFLNQV